MADGEQTDYYDLLGKSRTAGAREIERKFHKKVRFRRKFSQSNYTIGDAVQAYRSFTDLLERILRDIGWSDDGDTNENAQIRLPKVQCPSSDIRQWLLSHAIVSQSSIKSTQNTFLNEYSKTEELLEKVLQVTVKNMWPNTHRTEDGTASTAGYPQIFINRLKCRFENGDLSNVLRNLSDRRRTVLNSALAQLITSRFSAVGDRAVTVWELLNGIYCIRQFPHDSEQVRTVHDCPNGAGVYKEMIEAIVKLLLIEFNQTGFFLANNMFCCSRELLRFIQEDEKELAKPNPARCANGKWSTTRTLEESAMKWKEARHLSYSDADDALAHTHMDALGERPSKIARSQTNAAIGLRLLRIMKFSNVAKAQLPPYMKIMYYVFGQDCVLVAYRNLSPSTKLLFAQLCLAVCKEAAQVGAVSKKEAGFCAGYRPIENVAWCSRSIPLRRPPVVSVSEIEQVNVAYIELQNTSMSHLYDVETDRRSIRRALIFYSLFESNWRIGLSEDSMSVKYRQMAMIFLFEEQQMSVSDVESLMRCPLFERDADGWCQRSDWLLKLPTLDFRFTSDNKTNEIGLLIKDYVDSDVGYVAGKSGLLWWDFNVDHPDELLSRHPFQVFRYEPENIKRGLILDNLFHADYMKELIVGVETKCGRLVLDENVFDNSDRYRYVARLPICREVVSRNTADDKLTSGGVMMESETVCSLREQFNMEMENNSARVLVAESNAMRKNSENDVYVDGRRNRCDTSDRDIDTGVSGGNDVIPDGESVHGTSERGIGAGQSAVESDMHADSGSDGYTNECRDDDSDGDSEKSSENGKCPRNRRIVKYLYDTYGAMWSSWENLNFVATIPFSFFSKEILRWLLTMVHVRHCGLNFARICYIFELRLLLFASVDGYLIATPRSDSLFVGQAAVLRCRTNITDIPVRWYCDGICSRGRPAGSSQFVLQYGKLTKKYIDHVTLVNKVPGQFDLQFVAVALDDAGNYTCADEHGSGHKAHAVLTVLTTATSARTPRRPSTTLSATTASGSVKPNPEVESASSAIIIAAGVVLVIILLSVVVMLLVFRIQHKHCFAPTGNTPAATNDGLHTFIDQYIERTPMASCNRNTNNNYTVAQTDSGDSVPAETASMINSLDKPPVL